MIEAAHKRPDLTMPEAEAELLRQHYEEVDMILEYGSGGSTVMASEMEGKHITSVESNKAWWKMMLEWFETNPASKGPLSICFIPTADQPASGASQR